MKLELSLEQQLNLRIYQEQAKSLSQEQLAELVVELARQLMIKDNAFRSLLKEGFR